jgi:uncharacterized repeat protein (TIGR03803 family)
MVKPRLFSGLIVMHILTGQSERIHGVERAHVAMGFGQTIGVLFSLAAFVMSTACLRAQTFTVLHSFAGDPDGSALCSGLLLVGDKLFGTADGGGMAGYGTVFCLNTDGSEFTVLHTISSPQDGLGASSLVLAGNTLFGTATQGGNYYQGSIFSAVIGTDNFNNLHTFIFPDGNSPVAGMVLADDRLFGTTAGGGSNNTGTIFSLRTNGTEYAIIHEFSSCWNFYPHTNADGARPQSRLLLIGDTLYGTANTGGVNACGTIFCLQTDGSNFAILHTFTGGSDGGSPWGGLVSCGDNLYGTTTELGFGGGKIYSVRTNGDGFTILHTLGGSGINSEGFSPRATLALAGGTLFGTATQGGAYGRGTVFMLTTNGSGFTTLHHFTGGWDGADPECELICLENTLYGTGFLGGSYGQGTVFRLTIQPTIRNLSLIGTSLFIEATKGLADHVYTVLTTTNGTLPLNQWLPIATNVLRSSGDFNIAVTNAMVRSHQKQFYILQVQ